MKIYLILLLEVMVLAGCDSSDVHFDAVKVYNNQFEIAIDTSDKTTVKKFKQLFNEKVEHKGVAPNFKYLFEFETSNGQQRWRYSDEGYTMKYSQEDQRIYALINKDEFNDMLNKKD